jgi:long-chain acyl-CoA synthetase
MKMFGCSFCQVYGATETFVPMTMLLPEDHVQDGSPLQKERLTSAGTEVFGVEIKVVDGDDNELPIGQAGEIVARGDNIMKGYWNLESLTEKTLRNGWYHTGDIGKIDEHGYVYILDREKDMIISGGENIYPREVEMVLETHLAGYKKPRSIEFRENLPMSAVGKILKREIREEYWVGRSRKI